MLMVGLVQDMFIEGVMERILIEGATEKILIEGEMAGPRSVTLRWCPVGETASLSNAE